MSEKIFYMLRVLVVASLLAVPAVVFANHEPDIVHGTVFNDSNLDGVFDPGEVGIEGVIVRLFDDIGLVDEATTDTVGYYGFSELDIGNYTIVELDPAEHVSTTPNEVDIFVSGEANIETVNFGDVPVADLGVISGIVYNDLNRSRTFDEGDVELEGVTIRIWDSEGTELGTEFTNVDGTYSFKGLLLGEYTLREEDPEGYYSTTPHEVVVTLELSLMVAEDINFGDFIPEPDEISPIDLPITRFFDLPLLDVLELRSIDGFGYGNIAKVYFLSYLSGMEVGDILALREENGWGNVMKEVLGKAGLKGYNLGLIMSGREVPNQIQNLIESCSLVVSQEQAQELVALGTNQGTLRKLCSMVENVDGDFDDLKDAIRMRNNKMKWSEIQDALEGIEVLEFENSQGKEKESNNGNSNGNGPPVCKGKNKNDPGCD